MLLFARLDMQEVAIRSSCPPEKRSLCADPDKGEKRCVTVASPQIQTVENAGVCRACATSSLKSKVY